MSSFFTFIWTQIFPSVLSNAVYDVIKAVCSGLLGNDKLHVKLEKACDRAAILFYKKYGDEFGDKSNSFLAMEENWRIIITNSLFYGAPLLDPDQISPYGSEGIKPANRETITYFIDSLIKEIRKDRELDKIYTEKLNINNVQDGFKQVRNKQDHIIKILTGNNTPLTNVRSYIPFKHNLFFTGREEEIRILDTYLEDGYIVGITALGGTGKTQLIAEYALSKATGYDYPGGVLWVDATGGIQCGMFKLCIYMGLTDEGKALEDNFAKQNVLKDLFYHLNNSLSLIILDNLENPDELVKEVIPGFSLLDIKSRVVFTTRRHINNKMIFKAINLGVLPVQKCIELFGNESERAINKVGCSNSEETLRLLFEALGCFPMAIIQVSAYLKKYKSVTIEDYYRRIEKQGLLKAIDDIDNNEIIMQTRHKIGINAVLEMSWREIKGKNEIYFMKAAALFPESIAIPLYKLSYATGISCVPESKGYPSDLDEVVNNLREWNFITLLADGQIRLHPLIYVFIRNIMQENRETDLIRKEVGSNYYCLFNSLDRLVEFIKNRSIYALLDEIQTCQGFLTDDMAVKDELYELKEALNKNAYQIKGWPFQKQAYRVQDYIYQFLWHALYFTKPVHIKEQIRTQICRTDFKGMITEDPVHFVEYDEFYVLAGHLQKINCLKFSPDGKRIATCSKDMAVKIWDSETGEEVFTLNGHTGEVNNLIFSPGGKLIASCSDDRTIRVWNVETGSEVKRLTGHRKRVNCLEFAPDGNRIISCSDDSTIRIWDLESGKLLSRIRSFSGTVKSIKLSKDAGRLFFITGWGSIQVFDIINNKRLFRNFPFLFSSYHNPCDFSTDGEKVAYCSEGSNIVVWNIADRKVLLKYEADKAYIKNMYFSPDDRKLIFSNSHEVAIIDLINGNELLHLSGHIAGIASVKFSNDSKLVATSSDDNTVRVWDTDTGKESFRLPIFIFDKCCIDFSPGNKKLAVSSADMVCRIWNLTDVKGIAEKKAVSGSLHNFVIGNRCKLAVFESAVAGTVIMDIESGKELFRLPDDDGIMHKRRFSQDDKILIVSSYISKTQIWDLKNFDKVMELYISDENVVISPDSKSVACFRGNTIRLINLEEVKRRNEFQIKDLVIKKDSIKYLSFSPDAKKAVLSSDNNVVRVIDMEKGIELFLLCAYTEVIDSIQYSPDGKNAIVCLNDGTIHMWDIETRKVKFIFKGHRSRINHLAFSSDGSRMATSSNDMTVRVWSLINGGELCKISQHNNYNNYVEFSPDGNKIIFAFLNGVIWSWDIKNSLIDGIYYTKYYITSIKLHMENGEMYLYLAGAKIGYEKPFIQKIHIKGFTS